jgi:hypothetical protein
VKQLWGWKDSRIARLLLEEGFEVECGEPPISLGLLEQWEAKRQASMRRNVWNDREFWEEEWRKKGKVPRTIEDDAVARESYLASLESDLDDIHDLQTAAGTKPTAKAILQGEKRQTRALIAKARGVAELRADEGVDPDANTKRVAVLVYDLSNCSAEVKGRYATGDPR